MNSLIWRGSKATLCDTYPAEHLQASRAWHLIYGVRGVERLVTLRKCCIE
jgi:hypothetical protein